MIKYGHSAGRAISSGWSVNRFTMVVYQTENSDKIDNH